ncbi:hypothetical protein JCM15519_07410 [Fundidesulfovibrio butyratiphilus]
MTTSLSFPSVAVSVRQPWAWFICNGGKDVENRTWHTRHRGPVLIHASAWFNMDEVCAATEYAVSIAWGAGHTLPDRLTLNMLKDLTGGIVGVATIVDCVRNHPSPWAMPGHWHWVLADARPLAFMACKGRLGFFPVEYVAPSVRAQDAITQGVLA